MAHAPDCCEPAGQTGQVERDGVGWTYLDGIPAAQRRAAPGCRPLQEFEPPLLAGRAVPRWLVLGPALGIAVGMTAYFGVGTVQLAVETLTGTWEQGAGSLPLWFFWVAMPAYLVWGLGLGAAALAYRRATRPPCRTCGR